MEQSWVKVAAHPSLLPSSEHIPQPLWGPASWEAWSTGHHTGQLLTESQAQSKPHKTTTVM